MKISQPSRFFVKVKVTGKKQSIINVRNKFYHWSFFFTHMRHYIPEYGDSYVSLIGYANS
jgi:hypothetical protein